MVRAVKFCRLADGNCRRGIRLVGNWTGDLTDDQKTLNGQILAQLKQAAKPLEDALLAIGLLERSGFEPKEARGRAITEPFTAGERVSIKADNYHESLHGPTNDFEVVVQVGGQVRIRPTGDFKATQIVINRSHLRVFDGDDLDEDGEDVEDAIDMDDASDAGNVAEGDPQALNFDQE